MSEFAAERRVAGIGARAWTRLVLVLNGFPTWVVVAWLAGLSIVVDVVIAGRVHAPFVFGDELTYSELARALADRHLEGLGAVIGSGYGLIYPLAIAPTYAVFNDLPSAYAAAKVINALLMAISVVPSYRLAQRVLTKPWVLLVCGLTVIGPQMIFTSTLMTENAFFPVFLTTCLATVRMLERPTVGRQLVCAGLVVLAILTRFQAVALVPGVVIAILVAAASGGGFSRRVMSTSLRPYFKVACVVIVVCAFGALEQLARAGSLKGLLGSYGVLQQSYSPWESLKWLVLNLADIDLLVGVGVFALAPLAVAHSLRRSQATAESRALAAVFVGFSITTVLTVAAFSSSPQGGHRLHERYLVYLVPMLLILCFRLLQSGIPRASGLLLAGTVPAMIFPGLIPYRRMSANSWVDAQAIRPWLNKVIPDNRVGIAAFVVAALICVALVRLRRHVTAVVLATLVSSILLTVAAAQGQAEKNGAFASNSADWVDATLGSHSDVRALFASSRCLSFHREEGRWIAFWRAKLFNRSVRLSYFIGKPLPGDVSSSRVRLSDDGLLWTGTAGQPLHAKYVLADSRLVFRGTVVASDKRAHLAVTRVDGAVRIGGDFVQSPNRLHCLERRPAH